MIIALVLASLLFFGFRSNFDNLQANVTGTDTTQLLWDVVVQTYKDRVQLSANKAISDVAAASAIVFWNPEEVEPDLVEISSKWQVDLTDQSVWRANIFINQLNGLKQKDAILKIPVSGNPSQFTISDVVLLFQDGSSERASISTQN